VNNKTAYNRENRRQAVKVSIDHSLGSSSRAKLDNSNTMIIKNKFENNEKLLYLCMSLSRMQRKDNPDVKFLQF
jgi:hypothetical protein